MESNWATEHLQVIRTLMERSAVYRRALAPVMTSVGVIGVAAAVTGCLLQVDEPRPFILYWVAISFVALSGAFFLVRRQALKDAEPFWSPPTRRVAHALLPPLVTGFFVGVMILVHVASAEPPIARVIGMIWLPLGWVVLYGCAMCAAGFFTPRGLKIFGWAFILGGCALFAAGIPEWPRRGFYAHSIMGFFFGVLHLAYGAYLYLTEKGKNAV